jgi:hypothetical protein
MRLTVVVTSGCGSSGGFGGHAKQSQSSDCGLRIADWGRTRRLRRTRVNRATSPRCPASGNKPNLGRSGGRDGRLNVRNKANLAAAVRWASTGREKSYGGFDMRAKQSPFGGSRAGTPNPQRDECAKQTQFRRAGGRRNTHHSTILLFHHPNSGPTGWNGARSFRRGCGGGR